MWQPSKQVVSDYPTSNRVTMALASQHNLGDELRKPGVLAPFISYDVISAWVSVYPRMAKTVTGPTPGTPNPGIFSVEGLKQSWR